MNYYNISKAAEDNVNDQIVRLRSDINQLYIEMSNLFGKLKMDVAEANQLKAESERELNYIQDELLKRKMENIVYENKLNFALEKNAPYNNLHIPIKDVDPLYYKHNNMNELNVNNNLQSTSDMVYSTDMVNDNNVNKVKQLSNLAKVGQSLVGESEFIPIQTNVNTTSVNIDEHQGINAESSLDNQINKDIQKTKDDFEDMNDKLKEIENLNNGVNGDIKLD